ncbi:MAG: RraA family protein [Burkholderiaceae bacterium]
MSNSSSEGAAVRRSFERTPAHLVKQAAEFQAAILADVAGRRGALHGRIAPVHPSMKVAGPALTVAVRPGDHLMIHAALAIAQPGDVLVVDGKGDLAAALMGAIMMNQCKAIGLAGVVIDGAVRDYDDLCALGFPVFAAGLNPNGPTKNIAGRLNWPISIGGVSVSPGDLVVGDADGVLVLERERVAGLIEPAKKKVTDEAARIDGIRSGRQLRPGWLDAALRAANVIGEGETL